MASPRLNTDNSTKSQFATPPTSTFPTFLHSDPFENTRPDGRPVSHGSGVTDTTTSEIWGVPDYVSAKERQSNVPSMTGPVGEVGLPPSRSTSGGSAIAAKQGRTSAQPPSSKRSAPPVAIDRSINAISAGKDINSMSMASPMSRTHVPSVTQQGFFRPMSSQKLQAQRNQRPGSALTLGGAKAGDASQGSADQKTAHAHRYSNASVNTLRDGRPPNPGEDVSPLPVSRGSLLTRDGDTTTGHNTAASFTTHNSITPLQSRLAPVSGNNATQNNLRGSNTSNSEKPPKSPRSFRTSFGLGSRTSKQDSERRPTRQHERLTSYPPSPNDNEKSRPKTGSSRSSQNLGKNYEYFAGNMLFFLSGRCLNTKARPLNLITLILTVLPTGLFFGFSAPWLWHHVSPAIPIIFAYFFCIVMSAFFHATFSDPGILPRNLHPHPPNPEEERDPLTVGPPTTEWIMVKTFPSSQRAPLPSRGNSSSPEDGLGAAPATAMEVPTKYCKTCNIWRPPRAHHCRSCDACIETQDHHCVWVNNCVGRRNYHYFFTYVGFGSVLCLLLLAFALTHVSTYAHQHHISFQASLSGRTQERVAFALFIYSLVALPYPGSLFIYHLFLISRGETTREYLNSHKFPLKDRHRPFSQASWLRNWIAALLRPRTPTYLQFKHAYIPGDARMGHVARRKDRQSELKGRYSIQGLSSLAPNGKRQKSSGNGNASSLEMKQLPVGPPQQPRSANVGGLSGPVNRTPR